MRNSDRRRISHNKRGYKSFPAVKITRLGVDETVRSKGIDSALLQIIKQFFVTDNRSGCRFITVDAYREVTHFYERNGFVWTNVNNSEDDRHSSTIPMFFDLKRFMVSE